MIIFMYNFLSLAFLVIWRKRQLLFRGEIILETSTLFLLQSQSLILPTVKHLVIFGDQF